MRQPVTEVRNWRAVLAAVVTAAALVSLVAAPASAASHKTKAKATVVPAVGLGIAPTRILVSAKDAEHPLVRTWRVQNDGTMAVKVTVAVEQVTQDSAGQLQLRAPRAGSGASWITPEPASFTLEPNQARSVAVHVNVPAAARGSGDRYLAVQFLLPPMHSQVGSTGARVQVSAAGEIILSVPGQVTKKVTYRLRAPRFSGDQNVPLSLTIRNQGTTYALVNQLATQGAGQPVKFPGALVIAGSTRQVSADWRSPVFCLPCHVSLAGQTVTVWGFPLVSAVGLVLLVFGVVISVLLVHRRPRRPAAVP